MQRFNIETYLPFNAGESVGVGCGGTPFNANTLEASAVYFVSKSSGAWKICGVVAQDLEAFGKVY